MSAMHHDSSPDLKVVETKLKDILEVLFNLIYKCRWLCLKTPASPLIVYVEYYYKRRNEPFPYLEDGDGI